MYYMFPRVYVIIENCHMQNNGQQWYSCIECVKVTKVYSGYMYDQVWDCHANA